MLKNKFNKAQLPALLSIVIIYAVYIAEKALKRLTDWSSTSAIIQAFVFTAAVLAVFLLLLKCKDYYLGLLTSILAFKIIPPKIDMLHTMAFDACAVYFLVRKVALVLFLFMIYRFYQEYKKEQPEDYVHLMGIVAIMLVFPFISDIAANYENYARLRTNNLLYMYAMQAVAYVAIFVIIAYFCFKFRGKTSKLICDYSAFVLITRMLRKATSALILAHAGIHVSKSYFCWIAICAVLMVYMTIVRKKTGTLEAAEIQKD